MPASITLTVSHLPTSTSFFLTALQPLNYVYRGRVNDTIGFGPPDAAPDFWITQSVPGVPPGPAHVAFPAESRAKVHDFFHSALKAGGKVHGEPQIRDECGYYSAAIIDVDGNSIEAVFRPDLIQASKENAAGAKSVVSAAKSVANSSKAPTVVSSATKAPTVVSSATKTPTVVSSATKTPTVVSSATKTPTVVSSASKAQSVAPSKVGSVAPSGVAKSSASKAPSVAPSATPSKAPSQAPSQAASQAPSQVARSVAPSAAQRSTVSRAQTAAGAPSEAPVRTTLSRAPTAPAAPQGAGNSFADILNEARGTISFAREVVNQARPLMSTPATNNTVAASSPDSHGPSDAIVGTLLGVAAGAALHYAFSNRNTPAEAASAPVTPPDYTAYQMPTARSESIPSWSEERYYYYHQRHPQGALPAPSQAGSALPYAIEPAPSDYSRASGSRSGQRLLEMHDHDPTLSDIGASPRRRSSFSGVSGAHGSQASAARTSASRAKSGLKMLEAPPTSYRGPTVMTTMTDGRSEVSNRSGRSRSVTRPADEGYESASDDRKSRVSVLTIRTAKPRSRATSLSRHGSTTSKSNSVVTAIRNPEQVPLPASRAASHVNRDDDFYSTHSKANKTVIGRLTEKQLSKLEQGGRLEKGNTDITRSVIGKIKETDSLDLSPREVGPEDSVSQISSVRSSRRSAR